MPTLHWLTRDEDLKTAGKAAYRLLEPDAALSAGEAESENLLIQGDNLEALKALLPFYAGRVKCIAIDPPYNTRSAFTHYDDNLEHTTWLAMMYPRLELLRDLLSEDGSIWVCIDDNEAHYLKVVMDEVFGRGNFRANVVWQKRTSPDARIDLGDAQDHIMVFCKSNEYAAFNKIPMADARKSSFENPDNDPRGAWSSTDFTAQGWRPNQMYKITSPSGVKFDPPTGRCWSNIEPEFNRLLADNRIWFGKTGKSRPRVKNFLSESEGIRSWSWWSNAEVGHNQEAKKEINAIFGADDAFATPKPERLLQRILTIATNPGDLVLDSFLGSGTTAAVAHKMGRRWIGIEMGEHAVTHCVPRMKKVVEGEQGGISEAVGWKGGGGFRFHRLGPAVFDEAGRLNPAIKFAQLAAHVWFAETGRAWGNAKKKSPLLGLHRDRAIYLLYNGILGDRAADGGNVLTRRLLRDLPPHDGPKTIYAECSRLSDEALRDHQITFKQIPYEVKAR